LTPQPKTEDLVRNMIPAINVYDPVEDIPSSANYLFQK
jgi:hypothetical protein